MYFQYTLIAFAVILVVAALSFILMKRAGLLDKGRMLYLITGTVLAMACASVFPLPANLFIRRLYFPVFTGMLLSFILCAGLSCWAFAALKPLLDQKLLKNNEVLSETDAAEIKPSCEAGLFTQTESVGVLSATKELHTQAAPSEETEAAWAIACENYERDTLDEAAAAYDSAPQRAESLSALLETAMQFKERRSLEEAILCYEKALEHEADHELKTLVVLDLCALYKMTNQAEKVYNLLNSGHNNMLDLEIKEEILRNL
ncbi:MAG: hypothetical protein N2376_03125 [Clostridia bacterium]|nr:hypothetical protein [Clostridia bacterium]